MKTYEEESVKAEWEAQQMAQAEADYFAQAQQAEYEAQQNAQGQAEYESQNPY